MELLLSHCALDALVDSNERHDPPKCAPETRDAIQEEIIAWINSLTLSGLVLWLTGSAGSGKSAIAQTIAERFMRDGTPCASFFFSRISGSATRVNGDRLLPTIIYQLALHLPEYKAAVLRAIAQDPSIFQRSRSAQVTALFTIPLQQFSIRRWFREFLGGCPPLLIVVDGLDECRDHEVQCDLLSIIADAASSIRHRPLRFLIASRPEGHIKRAFHQPSNCENVGLCCIHLDHNRDASNDIMKFLHQGFRRIREEHPCRANLKYDWPGQDILDLIVSKSSPQFILASLAMIYVSSPRHQPIERLDTIMNILNTSSTAPSIDQPLERLDKLYSHVFMDVEQEHSILVQAVLGILHLASLEEYHLPPVSAVFLEETLGLRPGDVHLRLEFLASVIYLPDNPNDPIKSLHASLFDFLLHYARSHELMLNLSHARAGLVGYYFGNKGAYRFVL